MFLHVQSTQTLRVDKPCFFQTFYFTKCASFLLKIGEILKLMIRKEKTLELMNYFFITDLSTFGSKVFLTQKIIDFENVPLTKIVHVYMIEGMNT
jgi:hypothetical protein